MQRAQRLSLITIALLAVLAAFPAIPQSASGPLSVAKFSSNGQLLKPTDLDRWVLMGTSMGLGYNQQPSQANGPGQFNVVLLEPQAYAYFKANGKYADGTMFLLSFYSVDQKLSIARSGFVQGDLTSFEIHLIDRRDADGHRFFPFAKDATQSKALAPKNECVQCHVRDGAYDGTFAQFYPAIRHEIPKEALEKALNKNER